MIIAVVNVNTLSSACVVSRRFRRLPVSTAIAAVLPIPRTPVVVVAPLVATPRSSLGLADSLGASVLDRARNLCDLRADRGRADACRDASLGGLGAGAVVCLGANADARRSDPDC